MRIKSLFFLALAVVTLSACTTAKLPDLTTMFSGQMPAMRWDHRPEAQEWTQRSLIAIANQDASLASRVPADIGTWCPGYAKATLPERRAFWAGLLSAVAKHESTWNPRAAGGGGRWIGLMQISPGTAANYRCAARSSASLKDGGANLECAVKIVAAQVGRDGVVAGNGGRGIGRDWAPLKNRAKRSEMAGWTSQQSYCQ